MSRKEWWNEGMYTDVRVVIQKLLHHCDPSDNTVFTADGRLLPDAVNWHFEGEASQAEIDRVTQEVRQQNEVTK